jgi:predicted phosphodiesterase
MRTLAVLSDIHGNLPALEAVMLDMNSLAVGEVIVAGDSILGPHSEEVIDYIIDHNWLVIKGNYEINLLDKGNSIYEENRMTQENYPIPVWLNEIVPDRLKAKIAEWPDKLSLKFPDAPAICVVHGTPRNAWESIYPSAADEEIEELLANVTEPVVTLIYQWIKKQVDGEF